MVIIEFNKRFRDGTNVTEFRMATPRSFHFFLRSNFYDRSATLWFRWLWFLTFFPSKFLRSRSPPDTLMPATLQVYLVFLLSNMTRFGWLWKSCVWRSLMKSRVRRTHTPTTTLMTVPLISCQPLRLRSPRRFTYERQDREKGNQSFKLEESDPPAPEEKRESLDLNAVA